MYYANSDLFKSEARALTEGASPAISWFCLDGAAVDDVDFSAAAALHEAYELLKQRGIRLVLVEIQDSVRRELDRSKITDMIGTDYIFNTIYDLENSYERSAEVPAGANGK
jgi:MFS superfamily sulfate permease-like transporter